MVVDVGITDKEDSYDKSAFIIPLICKLIEQNTTLKRLEVGIIIIFLWDICLISH